MAVVELRGYVNQDRELILCDPVPREFWGKKIKITITPTGDPLPEDGSDPCAQADSEAESTA